MQLELYQMEGCPYCAKVREKLSELGVTWVAHNPRENEEKMDRMIELGGQDQVPFLVVKEDGEVQETMYESDDINTWLDEHTVEAETSISL